MTTHTDTLSTTTTTDTTTGSGRASDRDARRRPYDTVAFFRKRWMISVLFLFFIPAMIVICLTGPVYQNDNGSATTWTDKQRYQAAIGGAVFMAVGLLRLFAMPAS